MSKRPFSELAALVNRASTHPEGLGPLLDSHLETAACLYQLQPDTIEAVRAWAVHSPGAFDAARAQSPAGPIDVVMGECWARDGLQSEPTFVPTSRRWRSFAAWWRPASPASKPPALPTPSTSPSSPTPRRC